ncbi:DNA helicase-2 / ATP-dependent DNA helicase PcrA [Proteiniborus ethanoligenes]|uniref:ATP-dependent DNA helicase n=1 Tax=Proteiniborus ethanoligenes TaxID=415015 RepID=A0A1H3Q7M0_9FIRM|nr:DNA helicase PcrA [Proteiniborus ethanoligenes]SDZ09035.1 DNA helicase-2 / ATP-dependent DNA helicase PcrA [Proteiniborus ethanoligenes]
MNFLDGLNDKQREAVLATEGPLLILAGAGSGKTRVLTHRIAHLIKEKGVSPYNILALTFTNKAANEMKERISNLIGDGIDAVWAGTFHSICVRILRRDIERLGYGSNFVIFDTTDQKTLIKDCIKELDLSEKLYEPAAMMSFIGSQKDNLIQPDTYINQNYRDFRERQKGEVYSLYQKKLKQNNALDFDDLIGKTIELFRKHGDRLEHYQERFKYILVDEYQDTNRAQYELINLLSKKYKNICVVGDDDQSIYKFRGADIRNILDFEKDYLNARVIKLEQNYRSTKTILNAANQVIENNQGRKSKRLWTANDEGCLIKTYCAENEYDEANFIVDKIKEISKEEDKKLSDFAILYRTNAQSRVIEESFVKSNIPYKIVGGHKFYDRKEIKDIIAYLRLIQNPVDDYAFKRIVNVPKRGIGKTSIDRLEQYSLKKGESLYNAMLDCDEIPGLTQRAKDSLSSFSSLIRKFMAMKEIFSVEDLIENIIDSIGYIEEIRQEDSIQAESRVENIREFLSVAVNFEQTSEEKTLEAFLANISLLSDIDKTDDGDRDTVTLMTFHSAKGLEFPVVFMTGMEESLFPTSRAYFSEDDMEEERRLCYVGITRAEENLYMTRATSRMLYGKTGNNSMSRFLKEIPQELMEDLSDNKMKSTFSTWSKASNSESPKYFTGYTVENTRKSIGAVDLDIHVGVKVKHKDWGIGTVVAIKDDGNDKQLSIAFEGQGIKKLMLSFAPIEVIS